MEVREIIWLEFFVEKLWRKHRVRIEEVEEVLSAEPPFEERRVETLLERMYIQRWVEPQGDDI